MELWNAYDEEFNILDNITLTRGEAIPVGLYHLVSEILVRHIDGDYLLMQRAYDKNFGGMWEATAGGSALRGETALMCAKRELSEETGFLSNSLEFLGKETHTEFQTIFCLFLCITDIDKNAVVLQQGETTHFKWVTDEEILSMPNEELFSTRMKKYIMT